MRALWDRIETWYAKHLPAVDLKLRPGASEEAIAQADATLGIVFPDDLRASFAIHDGQDPEPEVMLFPGFWQLGSLESLTECWQDDRGAYEEGDPFFNEDETVLQAQFHPRHIPIGGSPYWDYDRLLLDLTPGPKGHAGQLILRVDTEHELLCADFRTLLSLTAQGLEDGTIVPYAQGPELSGIYAMRYLGGSIYDTFRGR